MFHTGTCIHTHISLPVGLYSCQHKGALIRMDFPNNTAGKAICSPTLLRPVEFQCWFPGHLGRTLGNTLYVRIFSLSTNLHNSLFTPVSHLPLGISAERKDISSYLSGKYAHETNSSLSWCYHFITQSTIKNATKFSGDLKSRVVLPTKQI